jgi:hypothetical protein
MITVLIYTAIVQLEEIVMTTLTATDAEKLEAFIQAARENLDRIEALLWPEAISSEEPDLDPKSPLNKSGLNLTKRGVEVCYRMFDAGKTRYAVAEAMSISYGAATHRFHAWEKLGGKDRERQAIE